MKKLLSAPSDANKMSLMAKEHWKKLRRMKKVIVMTPILGEQELVKLVKAKQDRESKSKQAKNIKQKDKDDLMDQ